MNTYDDVKRISIKCGKENYTLIVESDDYYKISDYELVIVKQHGFATVNVYIDKKTKKRKSLGKIILDTEKNVYLKDRYVNENKFTLNYKKSNLTTSIKEMKGYSDLARENYYKNEELIMKNRPEKRAYSIDIANKFMVGKTGEDNYRSKLTESDVKSIRDRYSKGIITQESLAREYNVSKSTISSIITYKRWNDMLNCEKRKYNEKTLKILNRKSHRREQINIDNIKLNSTYHLKDENLYYYIENINNDGLVYMEVRDNNKKVIVRGDLLFREDLNAQTKREYSIASKYPVKTPVNVFVNYVDKLKEYI